MKKQLIATTLGQCRKNDRFRLSDNDMERTQWKIVGPDLFMNVVIRCTDGTYRNRTEKPDKTVWRFPRLVEMEW